MQIRKAKILDCAALFFLATAGVPPAMPGRHPTFDV